ncbi:MAG: D-glycerate dehydrogenase [Chitinophagaceae bacterium]|nr:D-glycerate dehydrogenase [Chitinophagaceae bacterium]
MKVLITGEVPAIATQIILKNGFEATSVPVRTVMPANELVAACKQHDALLTGVSDKIDAAFLQQCRHLKVIALYSAGYDRVDVAAANELKIPIGNTPGVLSNATADIAFLLILAVARKAFFLHNSIAKGQWKLPDPSVGLGIELKHKTLGIFGLGSIGLELARRCKGAYDMNIIYHNRGNNSTAEKELGARKVSFTELLEQSDILSVHSQLSNETRNLFNADAFNKMKAGAIFINTSRGAVHNEDDLMEALRSGKIWGAGLDVTNPEPMRPDNPLLNMPTVAVLPHIGSATKEAREGMARVAAENIVAGLKGQRLPQVVNPEVYMQS